MKKKVFLNTAGFFKKSNGILGVPPFAIVPFMARRVNRIDHWGDANYLTHSLIAY